MVQEDPSPDSDTDYSSGSGMFFIDYGQTPTQRDITPLDIAIMEDYDGVRGSYGSGWQYIDTDSDALFIAVLTRSDLTLMKATVYGNINTDPTLSIQANFPVAGSSTGLNMVADNHQVLTYRFLKNTGTNGIYYRPLVTYLYAFDTTPNYDLSGRKFEMMSFFSDY